MKIDLHATSRTRQERQLRRGLLLAVPITVLAYALFYTLTPYEGLVRWYLDWNPHFFGAERWASEVFTHEVYRQGVWWCWLAVVAAAVLSAVLWRWQLPAARGWWELLSERLPQILTVVAACLTLSLGVMLRSAYSVDEVFSGLAFSRLPLFQILSLYPEPNNHLLFNVLEGIGGCFVEDPVAVGRVLSSICLAGVGLVGYVWLARLGKCGWLAVLGSLVLCVQMPVWGFGGQARGYALMLLGGALAAYHGWAWWQDARPHRKVWQALGLVAGMAAVPAFLYVWLGLALVGVAVQLHRRQWSSGWWQVQVVTACATLMWYLPLLGFSGCEALAGNRWVKPLPGSVSEHLEALWQTNYLQGLYGEWSPLPTLPWWVLAAFWALLAGIFFLKKDRSGRLLVEVALGLAVAAVALVALLHQVPFYRVFIVHGWLFVLVEVAALLQLARRRPWRPWVAIVLLGWWGACLWSGWQRIPRDLYYYDVNGHCQRLKACMPIQPCGKTVWLDDLGFYWWYVMRSACPDDPPRVAWGSNLHPDWELAVFHGAHGPPGEAPAGTCGEFSFFEKNDRQGVETPGHPHGLKK
ncbi:MAG: hypothetical protein KatS3mg029_0999 [Saprospiraceae bacterium]|nr:MAG: hypothetical protein KatS3mg029_0999 [Saprospiraceae bacterium]